MRRLLLGAAVTLAAIATPAAPAEARRAEAAATFHMANHQWQPPRRHWRGDSMHWRGDSRRWRHWRGNDGWRWRRHPGFGFGAHVFWAPRPSRPCRAMWWDGWAWRCRW